MNTDQRKSDVIAKMREEECKFQALLKTLTEEEQGEADALYQDGVAVDSIYAVIVSHRDTTEYPVMLNLKEMDFLAEKLQFQPSISEVENSILQKLREVSVPEPVDKA